MGAVVDLKPSKRRLDEARAELVILVTRLLADPRRQLDSQCDRLLAEAAKRFALIEERCR
jgi:hypothetical protein